MPDEEIIPTDVDAPTDLWTYNAEEDAADETPPADVEEGAAAAPVEEPVDEADDGGDELNPNMVKRFEGKTPEDFAKIYRDNQRAYTRATQELAALKAQMAQGATAPPPVEDAVETPVGAPVRATVDTPPEQAVTDPAYPIAEREYSRLFKIEVQRMKSLGVYDETVGMPPEVNRALQEVAWETAHERLDEQQRTAPYMEQLAPQLLAQDVAALYAQAPVEGATAEEVADAIQQTMRAQKMPLSTWQHAHPAEKAQAIAIFSRDIALKNLRTALTTPAAKAAPKQDAPATLHDGGGTGDGTTLTRTQTERFNKLKQTFGGSLTDDQIKDLVTA